MGIEEITKEKLSQEVTGISEDLEKLKDKIQHFSEEEKKEIEKAEDIEEAQVVQRELDAIKSKLQTLKDELDPNGDITLEDIDEIEGQIQDIEDEYKLEMKKFNEELSSLKVNVEGENGVKGWFKEKGQWFKDQWDLLMSKEERKEHPGKTALRALGGIGLVGGVVWLGKKIFGKKDWESRIEGYKDMSRKEKRKARRAWRKEQRKGKSFGERPIGKILKWLSIGTGVYYVVHGFATGHWHPSEIFKWDKDKQVSTPEAQVSDYEALTQEQREVYENIGGNINDFYGKIREQDKKLGFVDDHYLGTISENVKAKNGEKIETYKGLVPFCIDTSTDSIKRILSEHEIESLCFNSNKEKIWEEVKSWGADKLEKILGKFVPFLESFKLIGGSSLGERLSNWVTQVDENTEQRKNELEYFFRQYSKVLVYVNDKKTALEYKLAEEAVKLNGYKKEELQSNNPEHNYNLVVDAMNDGDWCKENVENNELYKKFMSSRLFDINTYLQQYQLDNGDVSEYLNKEILEQLDEQERDILHLDDDDMENVGEDGTVHTLIDDGINELDAGGLNGSEKKLSKMCESLCEDIEGEFGEGAIHKYLEWFSVLCNKDEASMKEFFEHTGLKAAVDGYKSIINDIKNRIDNKTITTDDLQKLKESTAQWFALKKEIRVAIYSFKDIKGDNPDYAARFLEAGWTLICNTLNSFVKIFTGKAERKDWVTAMGGLGTIYVVTHPVTTLKIGGKTVGKIVKGTGLLTRRGVTSPRMSTRGLGKRLGGVTELIDKKAYVLSYITEGGSRNEKRLLRIAREDLGIEKNSVGELLEELLGNNMNGVSGDDLWRCCQDKNLAKLAIEHEASANVRRHQRFGKRRQTRIYKVNSKNVELIIGSLDDLSNCGKESQKTLKSLLRSVRATNELELCHDFIYGVGHSKEVDEVMVKSLGNIGRKDLRGLDFSACHSKPNEIYKEIALNKFAKGNKDKEKIIMSIIDEQRNISHSGSTDMVKMMMKEYEGSKHVIKNLDSDELKIITKLWTENTFDTTILRQLLKSDVIGDIVQEINKLDVQNKTWKNIGKIIENKAAQKNLQELKQCAHELGKIGDGVEDISKFINILSKMKKWGKFVSKLA